jgi:cobalt-zinc-cadmium efflux system protein
MLGTWSLFRQSVHLLFDGVLEGIDLDEVNHHVLALPGVVTLHDLHACPCVQPRRLKWSEC